jgi:hypothetical protein
MKQIISAIVFLSLLSACKERKPVDAAAEFGETADSADQVAEVPAEPPREESQESPKVESNPETVVEEPKSSPPPAPIILVKPAEKYNEFCSFAKKLETSENTITLTTENFGFKPESVSVDTMQCLVTLEATIPKGKRLMPVILPQSYFTALGMFASGQNLQVDITVLTLAGDTIEASLEYQAMASGPIANDTEFVRSMQLVRRISPPCQTMDLAKRTLVILVVLTFNKGSSAVMPNIMTRELPRIDYVLESCTIT